MADVAAVLPGRALWMESRTNALETFLLSFLSECLAGHGRSLLEECGPRHGGSTVRMVGPDASCAHACD